jgi:hypothetical protein
LKLKLPKTKIIPFGLNENQKWNVRTMGNKVRFQDLETGRLYVIPPAIARALADNLKYAARHAEFTTVALPQEGLFNGQPAPQDPGLPGSERG